jgi:hypothetical protein
MGSGMNASRPGARIVAPVFLWLTVATSSVALADAVGPPPKECPAGLVPAAFHNRAACVLPEPKNCPPGWRGELEGLCKLAICDGTDYACRLGEHCAPADLCVVEKIRQWGWGPRAPIRGSELAAPPQRLDHPRHEFEAVDVCGEGSKCQEGKCEALHVCLPNGETRVRSAVGSGNPIASVMVRRGGCAGCGTVTSRGSAVGIGAALLALGVALARRRRC